MERSLEAALIPQVWQSPRDTLDNIDSPAVWHGPDGQHWLLATAKETDLLVVSDASTGQVLYRVGQEGTGPGDFDRPNGLAVANDLVFVIERDNARVQMLTLPDFSHAGFFGEAQLVRPYGVAVVSEGEGAISVFVTDNYELEEDVVPPDSLLGQRVRHFRVQTQGGPPVAELVNTFGDTQGDGVLRVVESIAADGSRGRLLIAEEQEGASMIKVYGVDGRYAGVNIPSTFFPNEAEGIVLYACTDGGYWIATDQSEVDNTFHVFDRTSLEHRGSFKGEGVLHTDGIALTQVPFPGFDAGAFFAVHDDGNVAALRWADIAHELGLRADCLE